MTVAAGFVCSNGVILGADTELTLTTGKTNESKIFPINPKQGCYITYSGDSYAAKDLIAKAVTKTKECSADECLALIESEYQHMIRVELAKKKAEPQSWFELLVTIRRDVREPFQIKVFDYESLLFHLYG